MEFEFGRIWISTDTKVIVRNKNYSLIWNYYGFYIHIWRKCKKVKMSRALIKGAKKNKISAAIKDIIPNFLTHNLNILLTKLEFSSPSPYNTPNA